MKSIFSLSLLLTLAFSVAAPLNAQLLPQSEPYLTSVFPAGGRQGETVHVELRGVGVLPGENRLLIDGAAGVSAQEIEFVEPGFMRAKLAIAADAQPGRRMIRVHNFQHGATNFRYFDVGLLPETIELEPNDSLEQPQPVEAPVVINGRINPTLDRDFYCFQGRAGQKIVAYVLAHGMDGFVDYRQGFLDTNLTLSDEQGRTLSTAEDSLGLDPLVYTELPADGRYTIQVQSLNHQGSWHAAYRLVLGEFPFPTAIFPSGGKRGETVAAELSGPNISSATAIKFDISQDGSLPTQWLPVDSPDFGPAGFNLLRGNDPELVEAEPNDAREQAALLALPATANGRFHSERDVDWYRLQLSKDESILLQTTSQRILQSPVDTDLAIFDATGNKLAENDDGAAFGGYVQCAHDFVSNDSWLTFKPAMQGDYFVRVRDLNGTAGPRSMYRLGVQQLAPDFLIYQWPDAVPIWGPGTSAAFIVEVMKWGDLHSDIEVRVEGLPEGWTGGVARWPKTWYPSFQGNAAIKLLLTITAPSNATVGQVTPFRVLGRTLHAGVAIEREARYMTLYGPSHNDRMHVRDSPVARAIVADYKDAWVEAMVAEVTGLEGESAAVPVKVHRPEGVSGEIGLVVNGPTPSAGCGWGAPVKVNAGTAEVLVPMSLAERPPGDYAVVVARSWASDIRAGRPGPCTSTILLHVLPKSSSASPNR